MVFNDDKKTLDKVLRDFQRAQKFTQDRHDEFLEYYKIYRSVKEQAQKNRSNLFIPYVFAIIETIAPRIVKSVVSNKPFFAVLPNDSYNGDKAKALETLVQYQLETKLNFVRILTNWLKDTLIYGTGIVRTSWTKKTGVRKIRQMLPYMDETTGSVEMVPEEVEQEIILVDAPSIQNVDIFDFFVEPYARSIAEAGFVIHRMKLSEQEIKDLVKNEYYTPKALEHIKKIKDDGEMYANNTNEDSFGDFRKSEAVGYSAGQEISKIEVLEYWTNDRVIAVLDRSVVIKNEANPYYHQEKPFATIVDIPLSNEFYGIGEVETLKELQEELNVIRNQRMDNINLTINQMWKVLRAADVDIDQLKSRSGGVVFVDEMGDIEPLQFANVTGQAYDEAMIIQKDMDNASGVYDYARGRTTDRRETATTANILTSSANERFDLKTILMSEEGLKRLGRQLISLNQQFLETDAVVRVSTEEPLQNNYEEIPLSMILGDVSDYDVVVTGTAVNTNLSKEARLDKLTALYGLVKDEPLINKPAMFREIFRLAGVRDSTEFLVDGAEGLAHQLTMNRLLGEVMQGGGPGNTNQGGPQIPGGPSGVPQI